MLGLSNLSDALPAPSDADLVRAYVATGDEFAFQALVVRHRSTIARYLTMILRDGSLAEGLADRVFDTAAQTLVEYCATDDLQSWLLRIARRLLIDTRRRPAV